jgi:hypothetical protein
MPITLLRSNPSYQVGPIHSLQLGIARAQRLVATSPVPPSQRFVGQNKLVSRQGQSGVRNLMEWGVPLLRLFGTWLQSSCRNR